MRRMVLSASSSQRWKLEYVSNMKASSNSFHPVISESWLEQEMKDAQVDYTSHKFFRADCEERTRGGARLYSLTNYIKLCLKI